MFYICDIYDKATTVHVSYLYLNRNANYRVRKDVMSCNILNKDHISTIMLCVFDSKDGSKEWYYLLDVLKIISSASITIEGIKYSYYAKATIRRPDCLESIKSLDIKVSIGEASKDYAVSVAKYKLLGLDLDIQGRLNSIPASLIKGDTLVIPNEVRYFRYRISDSSVSGRYVTKVVIPESLCISELSTKVSLRGLLHDWVGKGKEGVFLIVDGDFHITPTIFSYLRCNIYVRGNLSIGSFNKIMEEKRNNPDRYKLRSLNRRYILADSNYIYTLDFINCKVTKELNNNKIKL